MNEDEAVEASGVGVKGRRENIRSRKGFACVGLFQSGRSIHDCGPRGRRTLQEIGCEVERREGPISGKSNFVAKDMRLTLSVMADEIMALE